MSQSVWVGCHSSVSPFHTGTPAYSAERLDVAPGRSRGTRCRRTYRPSTRAVSFIDSLCPICDPVGVEVRDVGTLVVRRDLEGAAGAGRGLLEDQGDVLAAQARLLGAGVLRPLQIRRQVEQELPLRGGEVQLLEEVAVAQVEGHEDLLGGSLRCGGAQPASRSIGQVMQRGPPRPRPSSLPAIVIDLDAVRAEVGVGRDVALVADDDAGLDGQEVVPVVPLLALGGADVLVGLEHGDLVDPEGLRDGREQVVVARSPRDPSGSSGCSPAAPSRTAARPAGTGT